MIFLKHSDYEKMLIHAVKNLPDEACGLLGGIVLENGDKSVGKGLFTDQH